MKKQLIFLSTILSIASPLAANATQNNAKTTNLAELLIEQSAVAYGGKDTLNSLEKIYIDYETTIVGRGQSRATTPPWDTIIADQKEAIDFSQMMVITEYTGQGGGSKASFRTEIEGLSAHRLDLYRKTIAPISTSNFESTAGQIIRTNGTLLLKQALKYKNSSEYLGEQQYKDRTHHLIKIEPDSEPPITLYIDRDTKQITKSERSIGNSRIEYFFEKYRTQNGILLPYVSSFSINGNLSRQMKVESYTINKSIRDLFLAPTNFTKIPGNEITSPTTTKIDKGVYWVTQNMGGGLYGQSSLFIELKDYVLMVGALSGAKQRIEHIKQTIGEKPIKYAVISHHHEDHIGGVQEILDAGISLIVAEAHQAAITESLSDKTKAHFYTINSEETYSDESMQVDIINVGPTPHAEDYLLVHLPKLGILFAADHFEPFSNGPLPPQNENSVFLAKIIQEKNLNITRIIPSHSTRIGTYEDLITMNKTL
ncbi:MBL fold metallo-hydrolase [Microbulbifer variabilis]|uniref:MBL fold metallo-hydrolase n=1 Tax=Microbulbifer variabilis TaxID=266805 RepID=UPI001CFF2101|nr:MBL fold metallo-hydrolase [Microbulbifer variabilis]